MNSIDQNQAEENYRDLMGSEAISKIKELVEKAKTCFFCTEAHESGSTSSRPMSVQQVDDAGTLWFLSAIDSHKNHELDENPRVTLYFQGSPHSDFLKLEGTASAKRDQAKIDELWEPLLKTWFTEGKDDPRITVIKFTPSEGHYWDTKHGTLVAGVKMLIGAATGQTLDDSIQGKVLV